MTEDDAKSKWCFMVRFVHEPHLGQDSLVNNRHATGGGNACIASKCMAWRWRPDSNVVGDGYCGIAGKVGAP